MSFLPEAVLSLSRRRLRSGLTVLGVACSMFAMQLIAAVSQHFTLVSTGFQQSFAGRVFVCERLSLWAGGGVLSDAKAARVRQVPGVDGVTPLLIGRLLADRLVVLGVPEVLVGLPPQDAPTLWPAARLAAGRWVDSGAVVGSDAATLLHATVGGTVRLFKRDVPVDGVLAPSGMLVDRQVLVPLPLAQTLLGREGLLTAVVARTSAPDMVARAIQARVHGVTVVTPAQMEDDVRRSVAVWNALAVVLALGALAAGGAAVAVTTVVAVHERTGEIAIRRTVGASRLQIFAEFLGETAVLTTLGWAVGTGLTLGFVHLAEPWLESVGAAIFRVDATVLGLSLLTALLLTLAAGTLPAWHATRVDVVGALRRV